MSKKNQLLLIVSLFAFISILVVAVSAYITRDKIAQSLIEEKTQNNLALVGQVTNLLKKEVKTIQDKVYLVSEFTEVKGSDSEVCSQKLAEIVPYTKEHTDNITRIDKNLTLDCAVNRATIGIKINPDNEIATIIKNEDTTPNLTHYGFSEVTKRHTLYLSVPVLAQNGSYYGVIGGVTYLDNFSDKYLTNIELDEGGYFTLLDDDGTILYYPDVSYIGHKFDSPEVLEKSIDIFAIRNLSEKSGSLRHFSMGDDLISVSATANVFPDRNWTLILTIPVASAISSVNTNEGLGGLNVFLSLSGLIILVLIVFFAMIMTYIINDLFKPLSDISAVAEKIGEGNLKAEINPDLLHAENEFGNLAKVIKGMAVKLNESNLLLEKKVEKRTAILKQRTEELEKLNGFMMGREARMAELKGENSKLKKELGIKTSDEK